VKEYTAQSMMKNTRVSNTVAKDMPIARNLRDRFRNLYTIKASGARARIIPGTYVKARLRSFSEEEYVHGLAHGRPDECCPES